MPDLRLLSRLGQVLLLLGALANAAAQGVDPKAENAKAAKSTKAEGKAAAPPEEPKSAKTGKPVAEIEEPKSARSAKGADTTARPPAKPGAASADPKEAAKLEELGAKIAEKLSKPGAPGPLVIRLKASERPAGQAPLARAKPSTQSELHSLVLAASQREASRALGGKGAGGHDHAAHWGYSGETGPQNWAALKPDFNKCVEGVRQSPINIRGGIKVDLEPINFEYRPSSFSVIDNGHTVQVNIDSGNTISIMGRRYELLQFHFHRPAEERVDGRTYDMVAHLVHKDPDGRLAVIAVLMDRGPAHPLIQTVWNNLPLERGEEIGGTTQIDLTALLPKSRGYYTYMGSLTTPPCSEGVLWMVMKEPVMVSTEQIAIFSRLYPMNARPLQPLSGRLIKESN